MESAVLECAGITVGVSTIPLRAFAKMSHVDLAIKRRGGMILYDIGFYGADEGEELLLLGLRNFELIEDRLEVCGHGRPLFFRDVQMGVGCFHRPPYVDLRTAGRLNKE